MSDLASFPFERRPRRPLGYRGQFILVTAISAAAVWFALSVAETVAAQRCLADGLAWNWTRWSCELRTGPLTLPHGMGRSH